MEREDDMFYRMFVIMGVVGVTQAGASGLRLENPFIPLGRIYASDVTSLENNVYKARAAKIAQVRRSIAGARGGGNRGELPEDWEQLLSDEDRDALDALRESRKFVQDAVQELTFFVLPSQVMKSPTFDADDDISWAELSDRVTMTVDLVRAVVESVVEAQFNTLAPQSTFMVQLRAAILQLQNELVAIEVPLGKNDDGPHWDAHRAGVAGYNELIELAKRLG